MDIMWLQETDLTIVTNFDEENEVADEDNQMVSEGDCDDVDIIEDKEDTVDMQFGNGSVAFNVSKELFRIME